MADGKVSICIPTYNRANLIGDLLDSILSQTYKNYEVIITDNSDNELTKELVKNKFKDRRISYYKNEKNLGMGGNAKRSFGLVDGEFFTFTPDDDIWIDKDKLSKQVEFLNSNKDIDIVYSNAISIDYDKKRLDDFKSIYESELSFEYLSAEELLPGSGTPYFLNILTPVLRTTSLLEIFKESFSFETEEYLCYYIGSCKNEIGFIYDRMVALREAEHYRTAIEDGRVIDWKNRKDIRIKQIFNIYNTLTALHPDTVEKMSSAQVQNFLAKHVLGHAVSSRSLPLFLRTFLSCRLFFKNFDIFGMLSLKDRGGKSFG